MAIVAALFLGFVGVASFDVVYQDAVERHEQTQDK